MYIVLCIVVSLLLGTAEAKCTYSFVVNEVDPSSCPCLLEQPSSHRQQDLSHFVKAQPAKDDSKVGISGAQSSKNQDDFNSIIYKEGSASDKELNDEDFIIKATKTDTPLNGNLVQNQLEKLKKHMKDLEIMVYQESVENRELKNRVIKQEQSVKDYKFLMERLKHSLTKQKVSSSKEKGLLQDEIMTLKDSLDGMKEILHKQDYYLKNLEQKTQDLQTQLNPGLAPVTGASDKMRDRATKVIPVQTTSHVLCDGISKNATRYKGK